MTTGRTTTTKGAATVGQLDAFLRKLERGAVVLEMTATADGYVVRRAA